MKFLSDILAKAGLIVDGAAVFNSSATGQTPATNDNSTKFATTAWVRSFVQPYTLPIASSTVLGGIKVGTGLAIDALTGVLSVSGGSVSLKSTQTFTATEGQSIFTIANGYTPGLIDVFLNGVYLSPGQTTATNGSTVTLLDPAIAGDIIDVIITSPIGEGYVATTDNLPEGTVNLYYTPARVRTAISLTTTGVSGAATYNNLTGVFNIPNYQGLVPSGGNSGQLLAKIDGSDYSVQWIDEAPAASYTSQIKHQVKAAQAINKGQAVYVSSSNGTNMLVSKASNASEGTSSKTMGLLEANASVNGFVNVIAEGLLSGLNTGTANAGDPVWLGANGDLIYGLVNKPVAPAHLVFIGVVTRANTNNGEIFVKVQNGFELDELHDLSVKNASDGDMIKYVASTGLWTKIAASTTNIVEGTNLYYTDARVAAYLTANSYATQGYVNTAISNLVASAPTTLDTLNELATALGNDPNFATTIATSIGTKVPQTRTITINGTAYDLSADRSWSIAAGVTSFNTRTGAITLTSGDVTGALGYTPYNSTNPSGYITGITSGMVTTALGYTPYNSSNPSGYISSYTETDTFGTVVSRGSTASSGTAYGIALTHTYSQTSIYHNTLFLKASNSGAELGASIGFTVVNAAGDHHRAIVKVTGNTGNAGGQYTIYTRRGSDNATVEGYYQDENGNVKFPNYVGIGQDPNTGYKLIVSGSMYLNANGNGWAEGTWKQRRAGSTFYDVIDAGNISSQSVAYATQLKWTGAGSPATDANTFGPGIISNYYSGGAITNVPDSSYGSLYNFGGYNVSSLALQLYTTVNHNSSSSTRGLYYRMGNNLGFQNDWRRILDATDYSYAAAMNQHVRQSDDVTFAIVRASNHMVSKTIYSGGGNLIAGNNLEVPSGDRGFEVSASGGVSIYSNEINAGAQGGTGQLYLGWRRTTQINIGATLSSSSTIYTTGEGSFGPDGGTDTGVRINYATASSGYGRIRFYQSGTNASTIHSFSSSWQGGTLSSASSGAINISGQTGTTFGDWNSPDAYIARSGNIWGRYDIIAYSDARVKENVTTILDPLEKINKIRGVTFTRNDHADKSRVYTGVIAQELLPVIPEVVNQDSQGMYSVAYGNMAGLFIEAIKEQQSQIASQQSEIAELKDLVKQLLAK